MYPRKSKSKTNGKKSVDMVDPDAEDDDEGHKDSSAEKELNGHGKGQQYHLRNEEDENHHGLLQETEGKGGGDDSGLNGEITIPMLRGKNLSLLTNQ